LVVEAQVPQEFAHGVSGVPVETHVTMAVQLLILGLLLVALISWRRRRFSNHGQIMGLATVISLSSFAIVMLPAFTLAVADFIVDFQSGSLRAQVNLAHALTGTVAICLSVYVSGKWAWNRFRLGKGCYQRNLMRATIGAWLIALFFGALVYLAHLQEWM
jgi:hypothetical protein